MRTEALNCFRSISFGPGSESSPSDLELCYLESLASLSDLNVTHFTDREGQVAAVRVNVACPGGLSGESCSDGDAGAGADR